MPIQADAERDAAVLERRFPVANVPHWQALRAGTRGVKASDTLVVWRESSRGFTANTTSKAMFDRAAQGSLVQAMLQLRGVHGFEGRCRLFGVCLLGSAMRPVSQMTSPDDVPDEHRLAHALGLAQQFQRVVLIGSTALGADPRHLLGLFVTAADFGLSVDARIIVTTLAGNPQEFSAAQMVAALRHVEGASDISSAIARFGIEDLRSYSHAQDARGIDGLKAALKQFMLLVLQEFQLYGAIKEDATLCDAVKAWIKDIAAHYVRRVQQGVAQDRIDVGRRVEIPRSMIRRERGDLRSATLADRLKLERIEEDKRHGRSAAWSAQDAQSAAGMAREGGGSESDEAEMSSDFILSD